MTLPTLIQHHRKSVVETRLKKFYSTINQAITLAEVTNGDKTTWELENVNDFWTKYISPNLKYLKSESIYDGDAIVVYLPDGSAFIMDIFNSVLTNTSTNGGHFYYYPDAKNITETKNYEVCGKDWFVFGFWPSGENQHGNNLVYHLKKGVEPYVANWNGEPDELKESDLYGCNKAAPSPVYCAAVIQRNGWKIPDNYPFKF